MFRPKRALVRYITNYNHAFKFREQREVLYGKKNANNLHHDIAIDYIITGAKFSSAWECFCHELTVQICRVCCKTGKVLGSINMLPGFP